MNLRTGSIFICDNLRMMRGIDSASVDLIATDPPFNAKRQFSAPLRPKRGDRRKLAGQQFDDRWVWDDVTAEWADLLGADNESILSLIESVVRIEGGGRDDAGEITTGRVKNSIGAYLAWMAPRIIEMRRILKPTGSLYLHCDDSADSYLRLLLDAVFGRAAFRSAITWRRTKARSDGNRWGRLTDTIFYYARGKRATWNAEFVSHDPAYVGKSYRLRDAGGRYQLDNLTAPSGTRESESGQPWRGADPGDSGRYWAVPTAFPAHIPEPKDWGELSVHGKLERLDDLGLVVWPKRGRMPRFKRYLETSKGARVGNLWLDPTALPSNSKERTGWPTQKPVELYRRIIRASSNRGDMVFDPFAGCSTTLVAARDEVRQWSGCDIDKKAAAILRKRLEQPELHGPGATVEPNLPTRTDIKTISDKALRRKLWRDQQGLCANRYCDSTLREVDMVLDHRIPKSRGGPDTPDNRLGLCANCNGRKGRKAWATFSKAERARQPAPAPRGR